MMKRVLKRAVGRPLKSSAQALTAAILEAASKVFFANGFSAATMRQIADEARVSPQTLYARFKDKTELYEALTETRTTALLGAMARPFEDHAAPRAALESFGVTLLNTFLGTDLQRLHRMVIGELSSFPGLAQTFFTAGPERGRKLLVAYLRICVEQGRLHIDQPEIAAEQFIGSLVGGIVIRATLGQKAPVLCEREVENWVRLAVDAFLGAYDGRSRHDPSSHRP